MVLGKENAWGSEEGKIWKLDGLEEPTVVTVVVGVVYVCVNAAGIVRHEQALEMREGGYVESINLGVDIVEVDTVLALCSRVGVVVGPGDLSLTL